MAELYKIKIYTLIYLFEGIINAWLPTQFTLINVTLIIYSSLFHPNNLQNNTSLQKLQQYQPQNLTTLLHTDFTKGLTNDKKDHELRRKIYGGNEMVANAQKTFIQIIYNKLEDKVLRILCLAAVVLILLGLAEEGIEGAIMNGISILIAVIIILIVTSYNSYISERQLYKIHTISSAKHVKTYREGLLQLILTSELLVQAGDIVEIDGILIHSNDMVVDESSISGQKREIRKQVERGQQGSERCDPFILSSTKILEGSGKILVLAVGRNTYFGGLKMAKGVIDDPKTPLQLKLHEFQVWLGYFGLLAAITIFMILTAHFCYNQYKDSKKLLSMATLHKLLDLLVLSISVIVLCVPEGIQLCASILYAYSIGKLKEENNLVRYVGACQIMAGVDNICSDKTGTLTLNKMAAVKLFIEGKNYHLQLKEKICEKVMKLFTLAICNNTTANIQLKKEGRKVSFQQQGNKTECALLEMAYNLGYDYRLFRQSDKQLKRFAFDGKKKAMATIYEDDRHFRYAFVKGAPELLIPYCTKYINQEGILINKTDEFQDVMNDIVEDYGWQSLRTILIAYKQVVEVPQVWQQVERDLILIGIVGIKDQMRSEIPSAIAACSQAGINVRMITGDNKKTAIAIAKQSGILDETWYERDDDCTVMQGRQFRQFVGGLVNENMPNEQIRDLQNFKRVRNELKVLARCTPEDKYMMVVGLQNLGHIVSITGDGTNDAPALRKADIGFSMGISATQIAKDASHIILLDDNFNSIVTSIKWGRNIYDSIRKFLQFQLSVNFVVIGMILIGGFCFGQSPFIPVQILWINLIMDTLASIALATQPSSQKNLNKKPYSPKEKLITKEMWAFVIFQGTVQIMVLCFILFQLPAWLNLSSSANSLDWNNQTGKHFSLFFNSFVFMQMFNEINAKKIHLHELNVFSHFFDNKVFIVIILSSAVIQLMMMRYGNTSMRTVELSFKQNMLCIVLGSIPLFSCLLMKVLASYFHYLRGWLRKAEGK